MNPFLALCLAILLVPSIALADKGSRGQTPRVATSGRGNSVVAIK